MNRVTIDIDEALEIITEKEIDICERYGIKDFSNAFCAMNDLKDEMFLLLYGKEAYEESLIEGLKKELAKLIELSNEEKK